MRRGEVRTEYLGLPRHALASFAWTMDDEDGATRSLSHQTGLPLAGGWLECGGEAVSPGVRLLSRDDIEAIGGVATVRKGRSAGGAVVRRIATVSELEPVLASMSDDAFPEGGRERPLNRLRRWLHKPGHMAVSATSEKGRPGTCVLIVQRSLMALSGSIYYEIAPVDLFSDGGKLPEAACFAAVGLQARVDIESAVLAMAAEKAMAPVLTTCIDCLTDHPDLERRLHELAERQLGHLFEWMERDPPHHTVSRTDAGFPEPEEVEESGGMPSFLRTRPSA